MSESEKKAAKTPAAKTPAAKTPTSEQRGLIAAAALVVFSAIYLVAYLRATDSQGRTLEAHTAHWRYVYLPDFLLNEWVGGDWSRFGLADRAPVLAMVGFILGAAWLAGRLLLVSLRIDRELSRLESVVFAVGLGLGGWSLWTLGVGLLGQLQESIWFWAPAVVLAVANVAVLIQRFRRRERPLTPNPSPHGGERGAGWLWVGAPLAVVILLGAMLPPWEFDVREYHLQVPREWFQEGRIEYLPHNVYGNMPLGAEMHAMMAMSLWPDEKLNWWWGAIVGKTIIGCYSLLTAAALFAAGRRFVSVSAGVSAALLYLATPWVAHVSMAGLIDGAVAFYFFLATYAVAIWKGEGGERNEFRLTACAGFLAGSAAACKYPALLMVVAPLGLAVLLWPKRNESGRARPSFRWKSALVFGIAAVVAFAPWFIKNAALTGNPVYPLAHSIFGGKQVERAADWKRAHAVPRDAEGRSYTPAQLWQSMTQVAWRSEWINPVLAPLALAGFVGAAVGRRRKPGLLIGLGCASLSVFLVWWLFTHRIDRFWLPALPALALVGGAAVVQCRHVAWQWSAGALVLGGVVSGTLVACSRGISDNRFLVSFADLRVDEPNAKDLHAVRTHPAHRYLNRASGVRRVLLVGDARPFDIEAPALYATCFDRCPFETIMKGRTRAERLAELHRRNISHVFVYWREIDRYRDTYGFSDYVTRELIRDELVSRQRILRPVPLTMLTDQGEAPLLADSAELFEVAYDPPLR